MKRKDPPVAALRATLANADVTENRRRLKKMRDDHIKEEAQEEKLQEIEAQRASRNKGRSNLTLQAINRGFDYAAKSNKFELPAHLVSPGLSQTFRDQIERADLHINILKIEQCNTRIDRSFGKRPTIQTFVPDEEEEEEPQDVPMEEDSDDEEKQKKFQQRRRAEQKMTDEYGSDSDDDTPLGVPNGIHIRARRKRLVHKKAAVLPEVKDDENEFFSVVDAVPSSKRWFNLEQDQANVESTLRLSARIEEKVPDHNGGYKINVVPAELYVHNFRSHMSTLLPPTIQHALGLRPRGDFEPHVLDQYVEPFRPGQSHIHSYHQTGILSAAICENLRDWISSLHLVLEDAVAKQFATAKKSKRNLAPYVLRIRQVWRASSEGFHNNSFLPHLEFSVCLPDVVTKLRKIIQEGVSVPRPQHMYASEIQQASLLPPTIATIVASYLQCTDTDFLQMPVFDANIRFAEQRFPADKQLAGDTWVTLPAGKFSLRPPSECKTAGMRPDPYHPTRSVPAWAEFDVGEHDMVVHSQRAKTTRDRRVIPFNYDEIVNASKGFSWDDTHHVELVRPDPTLFRPPDPPSDNECIEQFDWSKDNLNPKLEWIRQLKARLFAEMKADPKKADKPSAAAASADPPNPWARIIDYMVASIDIETLSDLGFPNATRLNNPIIAISFVLSRMCRAKMPNEPSEVDSIVVCTRPSEKFKDIPNATIMYVADEKALLMYTAWVISQTAPGIILTYNGDNFDFPYILDRSVLLRVPLAQHLTGIVEPFSIRPTLRTRGGSTFLQNDVQCPGVNIVDIIRVVKSIENEKLPSYKLGNVAWHYLKQRKADVHHTDIPKLYRGDPSRVARLLYYNIIDSFRVTQIFYSRKYHLNLPIMARVSGIQIQQLLSMGPGQQSEVAQLIEAAETGLLKPYKEYLRDLVKYKGATVIPPLTGIYIFPFPIMDFASLYPSIMIAWNLCITTYLTVDDIRKNNIPPDQYFTIYSGPGGEPTYWCKPSLRQGFIPEQLKSYLSARKRAKKQMESAATAGEKDVFDAIQAAIKVKANSVYGLCKQLLTILAATVTFLGRMLINRVKEVIEGFIVPENGFGPEQGFPERPIVLYGDTDSVFPYFGPITFRTAFALGRFISGLATGMFVGHAPISLEFEKVYYPFCIPTKKRYNGLKWLEDIFESTGGYAKLDSKGSDIVRSDACRAQKEILTDVTDMIMLGRLKADSASIEILRAVFDEHAMLRKHGLARSAPLSSSVSSSSFSSSSSSVSSSSSPSVSSSSPSVSSSSSSSSAVPSSVSLRKDIIDFDAPVFVDPNVYWSNPADPDFTAPVLKPFNPKDMTAEQKASVPARQQLVHAMVGQLTMVQIRTRTRIVTRLVSYFIKRLTDGKIDMSKLVLSKSIRKNKYPTRNIQTAVAEKMRARGEPAPGLNDRVPYIITRQIKDVSVTDAADHPDHVMKNRISINTDHYAKNQIMRPAATMLVPVWKMVHPRRPEFQCQMYGGSDDERESDDEDAQVEQEEEEEKEEEAETYQDVLAQELGSMQLNPARQRQWSHHACRKTGYNSLQSEAFRRWLFHPQGLLILWSDTVPLLDDRYKQFLSSLGISGSRNMHYLNVLRSPNLGSLFPKQADLFAFPRVMLIEGPLPTGPEFAAIAAQSTCVRVTMPLSDIKYVSRCLWVQREDTTKRIKEDGIYLDLPLGMLSPLVVDQALLVLDHQLARSVGTWHIRNVDVLPIKAAERKQMDVITFARFRAQFESERFSCRGMQYNHTGKRSAAGKRLEHNLEFTHADSQEKRIQRAVGPASQTNTISRIFAQSEHKSEVRTKRIISVPPRLRVETLRRTGNRIQLTEADMKKVRTIISKRRKVAIEESIRFITQASRDLRAKRMGHVDDNNKTGFGAIAGPREDTCVLCKLPISVGNSFNRTTRDYMCERCACDGQHVVIHQRCGCRRDRYGRYCAEVLHITKEQSDTMWQGCVTCAGSQTEADNCANDDCPMFRIRQTTKWSVEDQTKNVKAMERALRTNQSLSW